MYKLLGLKRLCVAAVVLGFTLMLPARIALDWYLLSDRYIRPVDANIRTLVWKGYYVYLTFPMSFIRFNMPAVGFLVCFLGAYFYKKLTKRT